MTATAQTAAAVQAPANPAKAPARPTRIAVICAEWPESADIAATSMVRALSAQGAQIALWPIRSAQDPMERSGYGGGFRPITPDAPAPQPSLYKGLIHALGAPGFSRALSMALVEAVGSLSLAPVAAMFRIAAILSEEEQPPEMIFGASPAQPRRLAQCAAMLSSARWSFRVDGAALHGLSPAAMAELVGDAALVIAPTPQARKQLREAGIAANRILMAVDAPGADKDAARPRPAMARRGEFEIDLVRMRAIGPLTPHAAVDDLLAALAQLPDKLFWRFEHHGDGPESARLHALARQLGLGKRVRWQAMPPDGDLSPLLHETDIFIHTSRPQDNGSHSGLPAPLLMAAVAQCGIVATRNADISALLQHEESALLLRHGRIEELADSLTRAARNSELRAGMGAQARAATAQLLLISEKKQIKARFDTAIMG